MEVSLAKAAELLGIAQSAVKRRIQNDELVARRMNASPFSGWLVEVPDSLGNHSTEKAVEQSLKQASEQEGETPERASKQVGTVLERASKQVDAASNVNEEDASTEPEPEEEALKQEDGSNLRQLALKPVSVSKGELKRKETNGTETPLTKVPEADVTPEEVNQLKTKKKQTWWF